MVRKPRRPLERCDFCGARVAIEQFAARYVKSPDGFLSIAGIAHRDCAASSGKPATPAEAQ